MPQVIGLDIGTRSVKAALFERGFRGLELSGFYRIEFDPGDPEGLGRALTEVAEKLQPGNATIVTRIAGDRLILRLLDFPMSDARKLEQVIPFEVEQIIPYELEDLVLEHCLLRKTPEGSKVFVAAARKQDIRESLDLLTAHNLEPRMVAAGPAALGSLGAAFPALGQGSVALIDAGFSRTDVCVLENGKLAYARTVSAGWADLVAAHADAGGVLGSGGTGIGLRPLDSPATEAATEFVAREIRRTLLSAETEGKVFPDRIVLFGGMARMTGFAALVERTSNLPVTPLPLAEAEWAKTSPLPEGAEAEAGAAVALAFRVIADAPMAGINFRKDEFAFKRDSKELSGVFARIFAVGAALFLLAIVHYGVQERLLASERRALDREIANEVMATFPETPRDRLTSPDMARSIMQGNMAEARGRLEELGGGTSALDVLRDFSDSVPPGTYIDVTKFSFNEGKATVQCVVDNFEASDKLAEALRKVKAFIKVDARDSGGAAGGKRKATITFEVGAGGEVALR